MSSEDRVVELASVKPKRSDLGEELGVGSVLPFTTFGSESGELRNDSAISIDQLVEMRRRDGQARALMRLFTLPVRSALHEARWVSPEGDEEESPEIEFANLMFDTPPVMGGMTTPKTRFVREILLALVEGFSVFEEVRHIPKDGPLQGKITLKKLAHRDSRTIRFRVDEKGGYNGVRQIATGPHGQAVDVLIPREKAWYYAANEEENPFYGISFFESAWYHYDIKRRLYYIAHLAAQFAAVPGRIGEIPPNADPRRIAGFKNALRDFAFNTAMTHPAGFKVTPFNGNSGFDFLKLIDHHNHQMSKSVLARFLDEQERQVLIDNGSMADAATDLFIMALEAIMEEIAENLTFYLMPKYIDWNFGSQVYPVFRWGQLTDSTRDVVKDLLNTIATAQSSQWTPEFIRELEKRMTDRLGLEVDYEAVDEREEGERAQMEEQEELNRRLIQQQLGGGGFGGLGQGPDEQGGAEEGQAPPGVQEVAASATTTPEDETSVELTGDE